MRLAALLTFLVLAGCLGKPSPSPAPEDNSTNPELPLSFDCMGWIFVGFVPKEWVQAKLPPGYVSLTSGSVQGIPIPTTGGVSPVGLLTVACDSIHFPDGSVARDVNFAWTKVALQAAGGHEVQEPGVDGYTFELFFDVDAVPQLAKHFAAFDWPVQDAQVELTNTTAHVRAAGTDYSATLGATLFPYIGNETGEDERPARYHHVSTAPSYGSMGDIEIRSSQLWTGTLAAQGGFFGTLGPVPDTPLAGADQLMGFTGPSVLQWADAT